MAVELTLELVLNCQSVLPVSSSSATNSPVSFPVNTRPPPVTSMPAELAMSVSGCCHFFPPAKREARRRGRLLHRHGPDHIAGLHVWLAGDHAGRALTD